ncbi:MAG: DUF370 domain-containing protein [Clostridia bacterium]|jgi:hypothetical protein|nr:DUF370 domain-containing protein [Clostridia bacterium]
MYLHLGLDKVIICDEILGIFDLDNTTVSANTRDYLARAEKSGEVENICTDLPKSFVVCMKDGKRKIYITQIASSTILKRLGSKPGTE